MGMGHDDSGACRVLPVIDEEPDECEGSYSPEMMITERRKAIVSRMQELLRRAAHTNLRRSTVATAKKWKRVVGRIQNRGGRQRVVTLHQDDDDAMRSSISSSKSSFSWDATAAESCSSAMSPSNLSPLLFAASAQAETADHLVSSPATSVIRLSCTSARMSDDDIRMAHWVTTDSDFVVLEL